MNTPPRERQHSLTTYSIPASIIVLLRYPFDTYNLQEAFSKPVAVLGTVLCTSFLLFFQSEIYRVIKTGYYTLL